MCLDEPGNHLDLRHQVLVFERLSHLAKQGHTVIAALHDINSAARYCDHALLLFVNGVTLYGPIAEVLTEGNISSLFSQSVRKFETPAGDIFVPY